MSRNYSDFKPLSLPSKSPYGLEIKSADGSWLVDHNQKRYLDFISGISVSALGHNHPQVTSAIKSQMKDHSFTMVYGEFLQKSQKAFAQSITSITPEKLNSVYFLTTGSEAMEAAMKLAKRATGRNKLISFEGAYHGSTQGSLSISWGEPRKKKFRPLLPGISFIRLNNNEDLKHISNETAAVFLETIQGDAGVRIPEKEYMLALRKRCNETGALLILDEIQCGLGRTGKAFSFEYFGIVPDVLVLGKALGGGIPLSCLIANDKLLDCFTENPVLGHISTHGGNPLACAAGKVLVDKLKDTAFLDQVEKSGVLIEEILKRSKANAIRRKGLFIAVDLDNAKQVTKVVQLCKEKGVIIFTFLSCRNSFRISPPLNISKKDLELGASLVAEAINEVA